MVSFIRKRLQIFVSSTFSDLIKERQAAVEAILTSGHIPAGMELFTSGDETQMEVIKQWIDESDVYLLILAGRYGSIEPNTGKSYTELEYEYAAEKGKPLFSCVITDSALNDRIKIYGKSHIETENPQKLKEFRAQVLTKMVKFWEDSKDIKIAIGETLSNFARREDLTGWIRPPEEANMPALADEIARLSKENSQLRSQLSTLHFEPNYNGLTFSEVKAVLSARGVLEGFVKLAPELIAGNVNSSNYIKETAIYDQLGLIRATSTSVSSAGILHQYTLSDIGRQFLNKYQLKKLLEEEDSADTPTE